MGGPPNPYTPASFSSLYLWWAILFGVGIPLSLVLIGIPVVIAAIVCYYIFLYKAWNQIQDGYQRTSPGLAVGLSFIPFFAFYWNFQAVWGLTKDLNAYTRRNGIATPPVTEALALVWCILFCCLIIPYVNMLTGLAMVIIQFVMLNEIKTASMAIAQAKASNAR